MWQTGHALRVGERGRGGKAFDTNICLEFKLNCDYGIVLRSYTRLRHKIKTMISQWET